jgi:hypothetical protein
MNNIEAIETYNNEIDNTFRLVQDMIDIDTPLTKEWTMKTFVDQVLTGLRIKGIDTTLDVVAYVYEEVRSNRYEEFNRMNQNIRNMINERLS